MPRGTLRCGVRYIVSQGLQPMASAHNTLQHVKAFLRVGVYDAYTTYTTYTDYNEILSTNARVMEQQDAAACSHRLHRWPWTFHPIRALDLASRFVYNEDLRPCRNTLSLLKPRALIKTFRTVCPVNPATLFANPGYARFLTSPNYPSQYGNNLNCRWIVEAPPGHVVKVTLLDLNLELNYDYVDLLNVCGAFHLFPSARQVNYLTSPNYPRSYENNVNCWRLISAPRGYVVRVTVLNATMEQGLDYVQLFDVCPVNPATLFAIAGHNRYLASPNYPSHYGNNLNCRWIVEAPPGHVVKVTVLDLSLQLNHDYVDLLNVVLFVVLRKNNFKINYLHALFSEQFHQPRLMIMDLHSFCLVCSLNGTILSARPGITDYLTSPNFPMLYYRAADPIYLRAVAGQLGYLTSPNYPSNYENNTNCMRRITATMQYVVKVTILNMNMDPCRDVIQIFDVPIPIFTSTTEPTQGLAVTTTTAKTSDSTTSGTPLTTSVCSVSPSILAAEAWIVRYITTPNYPLNYDNNARCQRRISAPSGYFIKLTALHFDLESLDYLEVFDVCSGGPSRLKSEVGRVGILMSPNYPSNYNKHHHSALSGSEASDVATQRSGSRITSIACLYKHLDIITLMCSVSSPALSALVGNIRYLTSPNYPNNYYKIGEQHYLGSHGRRHQHTTILRQQIIQQKLQIALLQITRVKKRHLKTYLFQQQDRWTALLGKSRKKMRHLHTTLLQQRIIQQKLLIALLQTTRVKKRHLKTYLLQQQDQWTALLGKSRKKMRHLHTTLLQQRIIQQKLQIALLQTTRVKKRHLKTFLFQQQDQWTALLGKSRKKMRHQHTTLLQQRIIQQILLIALLQKLRVKIRHLQPHLLLQQVNLLTCRQPDCKDAGVYHCSIMYNSGTFTQPDPKVLDESENLTVTVPPGNITISVSPDNEINVANTTVELLCNAVIGVYDQATKNTEEWTWEFNDKMYGWRTYTKDSDIRKDTPIQVPGTCYYRQVCYLTLLLTPDDSKREYRCSVENNGDKDSASLTLGIALHQPKLHQLRFSVYTAIKNMARMQARTRTEGKALHQLKLHQLRALHQLKLHQLRALDRPKLHPLRWLRPAGLQTPNKSAHAQLQINPKELELTDDISSSSVVISCAAPPGVTIYEISLTRFTPQTGRKLVTAVAGVNQGLPTFEPHTDLTQYNANLAGGIGQGSITLELKQPNNGTGSPNRQTLYYSENVTFTVASGNITASVSPNLEFYAVNDTVTLKCIAIVGNSQLTFTFITFFVRYHNSSPKCQRRKHLHVYMHLHLSIPVTSSVIANDLDRKAFIFQEGGLAQLQLNPSQLQLPDGTSTGSVNVYCGVPSGITPSALREIKLRRFSRETNREQKLVSVVAGVNQGQAVLEPDSGLPQNTATVTGGIGQRAINLTLTQVKNNLTVTVALGNINSSRTPNFDVYAVNETVELQCAAIIGRIDYLEAWRWMWEYYDGSSMAWRQYTRTRDIAIADPARVPGSCSYRQTSSLTLVLKAEDSQRQYRCTLQKNFETKSAIITIGKLTVPLLLLFLKTPVPVHASLTVYARDVTANDGLLNEALLSYNLIQTHCDSLMELQAVLHQQRALHQPKLHQLREALLSYNLIQTNCYSLMELLVVLFRFPVEFPVPATEQSLARADITVNQGQASLDANSGLTQNTVTVSGSTSQKSMTLTLTQAECEDAGTYVCQIPYNAATGGNTQIQTIDVYENFTVIVPPGNMTMTADPQIQDGNYIVGEPLTLSCNCMIGPYDSAEGCFNPTFINREPCANPSFINRECASKLDKDDEAVQVSALIYTMGNDAERILTSFGLDARQRQEYDTVLEKFDE
ncbi:hypothetical protein C0Q70_12280 [Pomacea canaliculata]|uniref:CUB domain-containing protein n=1 Tax=Pomacea canaliculata TaxID=400727 RepID=A0A2T7P127_POMCA|nr:hypothetical protein C0Q70_12280 [Pomacea canaliculata]